VTRAVGYFRETAAKGLAEQSDEFLAFCRTNGYEAAATFLDTKETGEHEGFRQLVDFVRGQEGHGFLLLVIPDLMTLGTTPTEAMRRYFQLASFKVPVMGMRGDSNLNETLVEAWSSARVNGTLGDRVKAAMRRKAVKGEALGRPPYGYHVGSNRRLVIVAEEGSVVRYIFRLYLKDELGIRRIARRLNEEGIRTRRGGLWSMVTVRDILRNRAYVGTYSRFGVRVPASHAPLISREDFQQVQERLDERRPSSANRHVSPFLLSGLTYCGYCGNKMIGVTRKQRWHRGDGTLRSAQYRYYQCESRTNRSLCDYHTRRAEDLENTVRQMVLDPVLARRRNGNGTKEDQQVVINRLRERLKRLDKRLEQYLDAAAGGELESEKLLSAAIAVAAQQLSLEGKIDEAIRHARDMESEEARRKHVLTVLARLTEEWDGIEFQERQDLLNEALERIIITDEEIRLVPRA
jgi:DNA invertase Pin-like site-specific DNA recombinase